MVWFKSTKMVHRSIIEHVELKLKNNRTSSLAIERELLC